jgi:hypothetical protein
MVVLSFTRTTNLLTLAYALRAQEQKGGNGRRPTTTLSRHPSAKDLPT